MRRRLYFMLPNVPSARALLDELLLARIGAWTSGMAAAAIPNSRLAAFQDGIECGQVLLMIDVPFRRVAEVEEMVEKRHPEVRFGGVEPHMPVFP